MTGRIWHCLIGSHFFNNPDKLDIFLGRLFKVNTFMAKISNDNAQNFVSKVWVVVTSKDENWVIIKIYLRVLKIFSRVFLCSSLNFESICNYRPERKIRGMCLMSNYWRRNSALNLKLDRFLEYFVRLIWIWFKVRIDLKVRLIYLSIKDWSPK